MKTLKTIKTLLRYICGLTLCMLVIVMTMQVVNRSFFDKSFVWAEELAGFCMIYMTFFGSAIATLDDTNTRIDFFVRLLPGKGNGIMNIVSGIMSEVFLVFLGVFTFKGVVNNMKNLTPAMKIPVGVEYLGMFIGIVLMQVAFIVRMVIEIQKLQGKDVAVIEEALQ